MKILCTTDFSTTSVNAIDWAFDMLLDFGEGEIEILNCVNNLRRSDMFMAIDQMLMESAVKDMKVIEEKYTDLYDNVGVKTSIFKANPKTFVSEYARKVGADIIVTGTTGLTNLKNMTVGSVTESIVEHSDIPILAIPPDSNYRGIKNAVLGLGQKELKDIDSLQHIYNFLKEYKAKLYLVQVLKEGSHIASTDIRLEDQLKDLDFEYHTIEEKGNINQSINQFCDESNSDLLCLVHEKKNWLQNLFQTSITKKELFSIPMPLFIISS